MPDTMIERVAQALCGDDARWAAMPDNKAELRERVRQGDALALRENAQRDDYRDDARATIAAMREPTDTVSEAALDIGPDRDPDAYWRAMIDAALAEGE